MTGSKKNLASLDLEAKKKMIEEIPKLTISRQCELLDLNRSSYYYSSRQFLDETDHRIMRRIDEVFTERPYYGTRRMSYILRSEGMNVSRKMVRKYYEIMGIEAVYPKMNLSRRNQAHKIYRYLLRDLEVTKVNQVYCADITYIRIKHGFVYLVAIMDWYSRYILSWRVSMVVPFVRTNFLIFRGVKSQLNLLPFTRLISRRFHHIASLYFCKLLPKCTVSGV